MVKLRIFDGWHDESTPAPDGDYVTYADYAELRASADAMASALRFYADEDDGGCLARIALAQHAKVK